MSDGKGPLPSGIFVAHGHVLERTISAGQDRPIRQAWMAEFHTQFFRSRFSLFAYWWQILRRTFTMPGLRRTSLRELTKSIGPRIPIKISVGPYVSEQEVVFAVN